MEQSAVYTDFQVPKFLWLWNQLLDFLPAPYCTTSWEFFFWQNYQILYLNMSQKDKTSSTSQPRKTLNKFQPPIPSCTLLELIISHWGCFILHQSKNTQQPFLNIIFPPPSCQKLYHNTPNSQLGQNVYFLHIWWISMQSKTRSFIPSKYIACPVPCGLFIMNNYPYPWNSVSKILNKNQQKKKMNLCL